MQKNLWLKIPNWGGGLKTNKKRSDLYLRIFETHEGILISQKYLNSKWHFRPNPKKKNKTLKLATITVNMPFEMSVWGGLPPSICSELSDGWGGGRPNWDFYTKFFLYSFRYDKLCTKLEFHTEEPVLV